jgi:endoplasmic reticulum Man9GlcNAc2 1,2-alpha-mannosidase
MPDFADPQRQLEDRVWASVPGRGKRHGGGIMGGVQDRVNSLFDDNALPMYKDKPFGYAGRRRPIWRKKRVLGPLLGGAVFLLYIFGFFSHSAERRNSTSAWPWMGLSQERLVVDWDKRRQHVVEAFEISWDAYERYAWGKDMLGIRFQKPRADRIT